MGARRRAGRGRTPGGAAPGRLTIEVAIVCRDRSPTLGRCLTQLAAAGVDHPRVVPIGPDGPAMARNLVLAFTAADVLALVEDDVLVAPGWFHALQDAWEPDVAVAGGPLAGPPGSTVVTGEAPTYPGGNVAFRTAALRGAGGFWPARGHPLARDWFSEEHEAQRELARMGWRSAFAPEMAARRIGGPPPLRRRLRTGARRQALGEPRGKAEAWRALATGLAGAPFGHRAERLGRAAENAGVLLGPRVARRELEPVVAETPFRPSVPLGPAKGGRRAGAKGPGPKVRGAAWRGRHGPTVLLYHRIADLDSDPLGLAVSPAHFAEHLDVLRDRGVIGLAEAAAGAPGIAVTFDDGYADNLVLRDAGIPVTLFVTTGAVEGGHGFWWDAIDRVCRERAGERIHVEDRAFVLGPVARAHLHQWLQPRDPRDIDAVLQALGALDGDRPLTLDELRELAGHVEIGAHTRTHRSLRHATTAEQRAEIERSRDDLAQWLGRAPAAFSYPFGVPGDAFDATAKRLVREAGFTCAVANAPESSADRFAIPRHTAPDVDGEGFARWLDALG